jgi:hypothetical protein
MYVRFRPFGRSLQASLAETRRIGGRPRSQLIGLLGSVDNDLSIRTRIAFWAALPGRLAALANRIRPEDHGAIYAALHARFPMVTSDEQRAIQTENAKDDERFWNAMHDMNAATAEEHKLMDAIVQAKCKRHESLAADAAEKRDAARERLVKLARGESVAGGLGKKLDREAAAKQAGLTAKDIRRAARYASLDEVEFNTAFEQADPGKAATEASDKAMDREVRRVLRQRSQ